MVRSFLTWCLCSGWVTNLSKLSLHFPPETSDTLIASKPRRNETQMPAKPLPLRPTQWDIIAPNSVPSGYSRQAQLEYALKLADKAFGK